MAPPPSSDELAEDRTDLAEDRTLLANERTFASWLRTGMACVAVGLGFRALLRTYEPDWIPKTIASAFILAAVLIMLLGMQRARRVTHRLDNHQVGDIQSKRVLAITLLLVAASLALAVVLWLVD